MCNNILEPDRPQMKIWPMRSACWITKATNTHPEYVILTALPLHQWLQECVSTLRYTYIGCVVYSAGDTIISFVLPSEVGSLTYLNLPTRLRYEERKLPPSSDMYVTHPVLWFVAHTRLYNDAQSAICEIISITQNILFFMLQTGRPTSECCVGK